MARTEIGRIMKAIREAKKQPDHESMKKALDLIYTSWAKGDFK